MPFLDVVALDIPFVNKDNSTSAILRPRHRFLSVQDAFRESAQGWECGGWRVLGWASGLSPEPWVPAGPAGCGLATLHWLSTGKTVKEPRQRQPVRSCCPQGHTARLLSAACFQAVGGEGSWSDTRRVREVGNLVQVTAEEEDGGADAEEHQSCPEADVVEGLAHPRPV